MRAVGAPREFKLDARIIVGLQQPASELVKAGRLRPDLAYRLDVVRIELLPLRDHVEDVDVLVPHLLERIATAEGLPVPVVTAAAMRALRRYGWPGNVRELEAVLTEAMVAGRDVSDDCVELHGLRPEVRTASGVRSAAAGISPEEICEVLDGTGGNVAAAAANSTSIRGRCGGGSRRRGLCRGRGERRSGAQRAVPAEIRAITQI